MRALTLDEKIGIKAVLAFKGTMLPALDMATAVRMWGCACGNDIRRWHLFRNHVNPVRQRLRKRRPCHGRRNPVYAK